jgi:FMN phosphatase YigB (HAD superfamily)
LARVIADTKSKHLNTIHEKTKVPKNRIILFDDVYQNVYDAREKGFSAIHANNPGCGINPHVRSEIRDLLDKTQNS